VQGIRVKFLLQHRCRREPAGLNRSRWKKKDSR